MISIERIVVAFERKLDFINKYRNLLDPNGVLLYDSSG